MQQAIGIENPSHEYLSAYVHGHSRIPDIRLSCVLKSAGRDFGDREVPICHSTEQMGQRRLGLRKKKEDARSSRVEAGKRGTGPTALRVESRALSKAGCSSRSWDFSR